MEICKSISKSTWHKVDLRSMKWTKVSWDVKATSVDCIGGLNELTHLHVHCPAHNTTRHTWTWLSTLSDDDSFTSSVNALSDAKHENHSLLSHHVVVYYVCFLFVCLYVFVCTVTNFSAAENIGTWNFACVFDYYTNRSSPILVNFGSRGVTAAALLPGYTHQRTGAMQRLPARLGGQSELGAAASTKAVWWDSHLASPLTQLLFLQVPIN